MLRAEWISLDGLSRIQPRRSGHVALVSNDDESNNNNNNKLLIFGGYVEEDEAFAAVGSDGSSVAASTTTKKRYVQQDLWQWQSPPASSSSLLGNQHAAPTNTSPSSSLARSDPTDAGGWIQVQRQTGDIPGPRLVSAGAIVGNRNNKKKKSAFLFGGWDPQTQGTGGVILDDVHQLDLETMRWKRHSVSLPDGPTSRHVAVALADDRHILLHTHRCVGYVWIFDTESGTFTKQPTQGPHPSSRGLHAATRVNDHQVVLFGGAAQDGTMSNEIFLLDTTSWQWSLLTPSSGKSSPSPRAGPCLCTYSPNCVLLFGGAETSPKAGLVPRGDLWAFHVDQRKWQLLMNDDDRDGSSPKRGILQVFGGSGSSSNNGIRPPPRNAATLSPIFLDETTTTATTTTTESKEQRVKTFVLTGGWAPFRETWDDCYILRIQEK